MKNAFLKKPTFVIGALLTISCSALATSCSETTPSSQQSSPSSIIDKNKDIKSVYGSYTRFVGYEQLKDQFTTKITDYGTDDSNLFENDSLVLLNSEVKRHEGNSYIWNEGDRYIYTRHLQITTCGLSFWQQYIGHYTWETGTQNITLGIPEMFSYQYFFGDASGTLFTDYGASNVVVDTSEEAIASGTVRILDDGTYLFKKEEGGTFKGGSGQSNSGLYSFNYEIADYHNGAKEVKSMDLVLDLNTMTYAFPNLDE